jgi:hypothetical protein
MREAGLQREVPVTRGLGCASLIGMSFEKPEFVEIKMDAEIGSYQESDDPERDPQFVEPSRAASREE